MTVASVDAALEEVRPYLLADGGDVAVVGVEGGVVAVALQGACSSCASSSATLKMGIERQLRAVFGEQLKEVVQVRSRSSPKGGGVPDRAQHGSFSNSSASVDLV
jgi:Fe-S cluster biogenesis protein NfuA